MGKIFSYSPKIIVHFVILTSSYLWHIMQMVDKIKIPGKVEEIIEKILKNGFEVALVGGTVRNILLSQDPEDWDLATNARPEEILKINKGAFYNNRFGTVGIPLGGDLQPVQITTYRKEGKYSDSRRPDEVAWAKTLDEDLARRDFTINAIALKISRFEVRSSQFVIIDLFDGQADLKKKVIRAVGNADDRFSEDALRLLRAIRFATTLGFSIEDETFKAIKKHAALLSKISGERIRDELFKIIESENPAEGIILAKDAGLLKIFLMELDECFSIEQKSPRRHHIFDVGTHCVMSLKNCPSKDVICRFATLLHDIGKAKVANITSEGVRTFYNHEVVGGRQVKQIADRLAFSKKQKDKLYKLVRWHQFTVDEKQTDKALRRFIRNIGRELIEDMMDLRVGDRLGGGLQQPESWRLKLFRGRLKEVMKKPFTVADLKVSGHDVMEILGINPGPKVGEILNFLFEEVAEDAKKNDRKYLLKKIADSKI